jgi:ABC-type amino acid transport substrate-binding protein
VNFPGSMNELAPAVISGEAVAAILDVPDALIALEKWPGQIKIIGPISDHQGMAVAFRPGNPELLKAFNKFFEGLRADGRYRDLVKKYYPAVFDYYPHYFDR